MIRFTVALPAVPKGRPRFFEGHVYTPKATKQFEKDVGWAYIQATAGVPRPLFPEGRLWLEVQIRTTQEEIRGDWDNYGKAISDALNTLAYTDDKQIKHATVVIDEGCSADFIEVAIGRYEPRMRQRRGLRSSK